MNVASYLNGNIYTMDASQPKAQALAIDLQTGTILAIGTNDEVRRLASLNGIMIDLRGRTVLPGFIDAHIHLVSEAYRAYNIDAAGRVSEDEVADLVRQRALQTPPGQWIVGSQWDRNLWPGSPFPTRASLDAVAPDHPVALWSKDGHLLWVNSKALEIAAISAATPKPVGGAILCDGSGEPTGVLQESGATDLVSRHISTSDPSMTRPLVQETLRRLQSRGITSIHEIEDRSAFQLLQDLNDQNALQTRVTMFLPRQLLPDLRSIGIQSGFGGSMLRLGGIKIFADGTLGSQTAAMLEGFEDNPTNRGILILPEKQMNETVQLAAEMGISVAIHAIGDRAAHVALNSIERAQQHLADQPRDKAQPGLRYRLEHVQLITDADLQRMRTMGVVASIQPFHAISDRDIAERYWGQRARRAYAYRTMRNMSIPLALGSDAPVETFDPLRILYSATRRTSPDTPERPAWLPEQSLEVAQALWGYTMGAAYAAGEEGMKGSLTSGKLGDFVVLREDILTVPREHMLENGVQATILGGKIIYGEL